MALNRLSVISSLVLLLSLVFTFPALAATPSTRPAMRSCEARLEAVQKRSLRLTELASTMFMKFDVIAQRVMNYYTDKVVPSGTTVSNYESLVAKIDTEKDEAQVLLDTAKASISEFTCETNNPGLLVTQFNSNMRAVKTSLQEYRTSVKNLIVAVRGSNRQNEN